MDIAARVLSMSQAAGGVNQPGKALPKATLDADEESIEQAGGAPGMDPNRAVSAATFERSLSEVADSDVLQYRLSQQAILADFGLEALRGRDIADLQQKATEHCAKGMRAKLCKLLSYLPSEDKLLVCAGVGWEPGVVGNARVGADMESPAGYAFRTGKPVISNHLEQEERFRTPAMMAEHGVRRAINVLVVAGGKPWGVLEVDSPDDGSFDVSDVPFLQSFANLLGVAIERERAEVGLREALDYQQLLVRESSHRTKNSLALLSSLLHLQAKDAGGDVANALTEAAARIHTISAAHDLLWRSEASGKIDLGGLLNELVAQMKDQAPGIAVHCAADRIVIDADRAIAAGLLVTELLTNAAKHAYPNGQGRLDLACRRLDDRRFRLSARDYGKGLPEGFDLNDPDRRSLGVRMVRSLTRQLGGQIDVRSDGGAIFTVTAPAEPAA